MEQRPEAIQANTQQQIYAVESKTTWTWRTLTAYDFDESDLTDDVAWNDLDLSSIVGTKKCVVNLFVRASDGVTGNYVAFRPNGSTSTVGVQVVNISVTSQYFYGSMNVETDSSGVVEIQCSLAPNNWTHIDIAVRGYRDA